MSIRLQERDQYLLELLASDFLLLTREQIQQLIPRGLRRTNQRLALLTADGYLARREPEDALSPSLTFYYLGENAARSLRGETEGITARRTRARNFGDSYLRHLHLINSVHIKFLTTQARDYRFLTWVSSDNREWEGVPGFKLRPDGFLRFSKDGKEFCYFVEVDRGTERGGSIRKKIAEYHDFDLTGGFRQTFKRDWFRVLFVVSEASHSKTLLKLFPSDTFWVAPASDVLSKGLFDPSWTARSATSLSLSRGLDQRRKERIEAQKEAVLRLAAPEPTRQKEEVTATPALAVAPIGSLIASRMKAVPWMLCLKILAGIAGGAAVVAAGMYLYGIGAELDIAGRVTQTLRDSHYAPLWLGGCVLAIVFIISLM